MKKLPLFLVALTALIITDIFAVADGALKHQTHVQINESFHLFQCDTVGNSHVLIYIQRAYSKEGNPIGWTLMQSAGPWGNSIDLLKSDSKDGGVQFGKEFQESLDLATKLTFVLSGDLPPSFWKGNHIVIKDDPVIKGAFANFSESK